MVAKETHKELLSHIRDEYDTSDIDYSRKGCEIHSPVVFVGQPEYFRSVYYDALSEGHYAYSIKSTDQSSLKELPAFIGKNHIRTVVIFRPEWFVFYQDIFKAIKEMGVAIVGYSTEPVPFSPNEETHPDKLVRLKSLSSVLKLSFDVLVHFDPFSIDYLREIGFKGIEAYPLPVSRKIFYPEPDASIKYDVCFLGRSTEYREKILAPLKCEMNIVHVAHGLVDEDARDLMNKSRIVLNIHNHQYSNIEQRVATALYCEKPVFSDWLSGGIYEENIDYVLFENESDLYKKVEHYLSHPWEIKPRVNLEVFNIETFLRFLGINNN